MPKHCKHGGVTQPSGNCARPANDGLPVQCIGDWTPEKYDYLKRYLGASSGPRGDFLPPKGQGGAAYIDLFAGPGRARVQSSGEIVDGSPLIALSHAQSPFTRVIACDKNEANIEALRQRTEDHADRTRLFTGDCNDRIEDIVREIPPHGLNFALIDPFGVTPLLFDTIRQLAAVKRMDIMLHFPTMDLERNFDRYADQITRFLGTDTWTPHARRASDIPKLIEFFRKQLDSYGYSQERVRSMPVKTKKNRPIYYLVYATKNPRGNKIWESITRTSATGQRTFLD